MDVIVVIEFVEEGGDFVAVGFGEFDGRLGHVPQFGGDDVPAGFLEPGGDAGKVLGVGEEAGALAALGDLVLFEGLNILGAGLDGIGFGIARGIGVGGFDDTESVEEEAHGAGLAELTGAEEVPDFGGGAVPVVGEALDDDRDLMGGESLVEDGLVLDFFVEEPGSLLDAAFDGIPVNAGLFGFLDGDVESRIQVGIRAAEFGGDHDFANEFADDLALFLGVGLASCLFPLRSHIGVECA